EDVVVAVGIARANADQPVRVATAAEIPIHEAVRGAQLSRRDTATAGGGARVLNQPQVERAAVILDAPRSRHARSVTAHRAALRNRVADTAGAVIGLRELDARAVNGAAHGGVQPWCRLFAERVRLLRAAGERAVGGDAKRQRERDGRAWLIAIGVEILPAPLAVAL